MRMVSMVLMTVAYLHASSQTPHKLINREVKFVNESIHGLLILHRIYESYNQDINKYVDLPSYELNNYDNEDLPQNVFDDPENMFYDLSPNLLFQQLSSSKANSIGHSIIQNIKNTSQELNAQRYEVHRLIQSSNINELQVIKELYASLESVTTNFDNIKLYVKAFDSQLEKRRYDNDLKKSKKSVYAAIAEIHQNLKKVLRNIGIDNQSAVIRSIAKIDKEKNWLHTCINDLKSEPEKNVLKLIAAKIDRIVQALHDYTNSPNVPKEYALFGKGYYYQNVLLLTLMNRYGNGYVNAFNDFLDKYEWPVIHLTEEPHYLKILYPKTTPKEILNRPIMEFATLDELRNIDINKSQHPMQSEDDQYQPEDQADTKTEKVIDPIKIVQNHTIYVDSPHFKIELYDHRIRDGDMVSINVNGDWLYNNISLEKEAKVIELEIDPTIKNFIMVQALNEGWRPPNTIGVRYISNGNVENIYLKTDLNSAELIEIKYKQ